MNQTLHDYQTEILKIYEEFDLKSFKGLNREYIVNGTQAVKWFSDTTRKGKVKYLGQFDFNKNFDDLIFCSDEIMYFLANMYLYRPHLNDPIADSFYHYGKILYPNYQNLEALRYSMFANVVCEKIYNFWDRIGDLLAAYFPNLLKPHQVFFAKIIDLIPEEYHDENYQWLLNFKENEFTEINRIRKNAVHYVTEDTEFKNEHIWAATDREKIEELMTKRRNLADYFKTHIDLTFDGFERTMYLIDLITEKTLTEIE